MSEKIHARACGENGSVVVSFDASELPRGHSPQWCVHFTGIMGPGAVKHTQCAAGVEYDAVRDAESRPFRWPCIRSTGADLPCASRRWPTDEQVAQHKAYTNAMMTSLTAALRTPMTEEQGNAE